MKIVSRTFLATVLLCFLFASCNEAKKNLGLERWVGSYEYLETPITGSDDFMMLMNWHLRIEGGADSTRGILEVNGQQTEIKWQTEIAGDSTRIAILFDTAIIGQEPGIQKGDTLFQLSSNGTELKTTWLAMKPRLMENPPRECTCFVRGR